MEITRRHYISNSQAKWHVLEDAKAIPLGGLG